MRPGGILGANRIVSEEGKMVAYAVVAIDEITNPDGYQEYRNGVLQTIEKYGGRFVVRGGETEFMEGDQRPSRIVVVEFPDMERAKSWYNSTEYAPLAALRQRNSRTGFFALVDGV